MVEPAMVHNVERANDILPLARDRILCTLTGVVAVTDDPGDPPESDTAANDQPPTTKPNPRNAEVDLRGEKRPNATQASTTDTDARLYKKAPGAAAALCFIGGGGSENGLGDRFPDDGAHGESQRPDCSGGN